MSLKDQLKVLVVDDTSVSRMLVVDALQQIGFKNIAYGQGWRCRPSRQCRPAQPIW